MKEFNCVDCNALIHLPHDAMNEEIVECGDCGMDYVVKVHGGVVTSVNQLMIDGEDWGEY